MMNSDNLGTIILGIFTLSLDDFIMTIKLPLWKVLSKANE